MSELLAVYDSESFMEEHEDQITEAEGKMLTSSQLQQYDAIYFWKYPGARERIEKFEKPEEDMEFDSLYRDEDGTEWGHISNYFSGETSGSRYHSQTVLLHQERLPMSQS